MNTFDFNGSQKLAESAANPDMGEGYAPAIGSLEIRLCFFFLLGAGIILWVVSVTWAAPSATDSALRLTFRMLSHRRRLLRCHLL